MSKLTKDERMRYERDLKMKSDYDGGIAYAIEKAEYKKALEIASKMKKAALPISQIRDFTKLSLEQIAQL
jgi:predicted transposase YdaD